MINQLINHQFLHSINDPSHCDKYHQMLSTASI